MKSALFSERLPRVQLISVLFLILAGIAQASPKEKVLYRFQGGTDGFEPLGTLVADQAGNLYGTTTSGGTGNCNGGCGTAFELSPNPDGTWAETILYSFAGGSDGAFPNAGMVFDQKGNLYGTTLHYGGSGDGTAFRLSPPAKPGNAWTETVLYNFVGDSDGEYCLGSLTFDRAGNLYGATLFGGIYGGGTIFQLVPPKQGDAWSLNVLHTFKGTGDGLDPWGPVSLDDHGVVYGTTYDGVVYRLKPPAPGQTKWAFKVLCQLPGLAPQGALLAGRGVLYATSLRGANNAGDVLQLTPQPGQWKVTTLYDFKGGTDGSNPLNGLVADRAGNLYGVTSTGGIDDHGTIYRLSLKNGVWTKTTLYRFQGGNDGADPESGVIVGSGVLYGTTAAGGISDNGTVFQLGR